jgi:hypothetical protein
MTIHDAVPWPRARGAASLAEVGKPGRKGEDRRDSGIRQMQHGICPGFLSCLAWLLNLLRIPRYIPQHTMLDAHEG